MSRLIPEEDIIVKIKRSINFNGLIYYGFNEKYKGIHTGCLISCKKHGNGWEWGNPWIPTINNLLKGISCTKCSGKYRESKKELIEGTNKIINNKGWIIKGIIGEFNGVLSKCDIYCEKHGHGKDWDKAWNPTFYQLRNMGHGCPKCSGLYNPSEKENLSWMNGLTNGLKISIIRVKGNYKGKNSKYIASCDIHGRGDLWDTPWYVTSHSLIKGKGCPKCLKKYIYSEKEALDEGRKKISKNLNLIKFSEHYKGSHTKCVVECKKHGIGCNWGNPWNPSLSKLKSGTDCIKCSGSYKYTELEAREIAIDILGKSDIVFRGFYGKYRGVNTRCIVECKTHGDGSLFSRNGESWRPELHHIKNGKTSCPHCAIERGNLKECLVNIKQFKKKRVLYFVEFYENKSKKYFYKIGVHSNKITTRFSGQNLKRDNIKITNHKELELTNIEALLSEYWCLREFSNEKVFKGNVLKNCFGGTECFKSDITKKMSLEKIVESARMDFERIIKIFNLTKKEQESAILEFNNYIL